jgi:hypothetical protein
LRDRTNKCVASGESKGDESEASNLDLTGFTEEESEDEDDESATDKSFSDDEEGDDESPLSY